MHIYVYIFVYIKNYIYIHTCTYMRFQGWGFDLVVLADVGEVAERHHLAQLHQRSVL